jgi:hypothetical protein
MPDFRRLHLAEAVKKDFRDLVAAALIYYYKELQLHNLQLLEFDVEGKLARYQIEFVDLSKQPYDHIMEQTQPMTMLQSLDAFKAELSFTRHMRFYVIILQPPQGQPIYFYRHYSPKRMLREAAPLSIQRVFGNSDEYEKVTTPIFLFDDDIDCISRGTNMFILAKSHFYYMFRILNDLIASARDTLKRIQDRIPIANFDAFSRSCTDNKLKMVKLTSIARRPYLDKLTIAMMKPAIIKHQLHIPIEEINKQEMLRFDKDYPWDILKLLADDYLTSIMTGQDYEVESKRDP